MTTSADYEAMAKAVGNARDLLDDQFDTARLSEAEQVLRSLASAMPSGLAEGLERVAEDHDRYDTPVDSNLLKRAAAQLCASESKMALMEKRAVDAEVALAAASAERDRLREGLRFACSEWEAWLRTAVMPLAPSGNKMRKLEETRAILSAPSPAAEKTIRYAAVSLIEDARGRILCVWNKRYDGWSLPGGMVEEGETPEQGQARELREETGLETVRAVRVFEGEHGIESASKRGRASRVVLFSVVASGEPRQIEEGCPIRWMTRSEFLAESPFAPFYARAFAEMAPESSSPGATRSEGTADRKAAGAAIENRSGDYDPALSASAVAAEVDSVRQFPVHSQTLRRHPECPETIPWPRIAPFEARARRNHDQSLEELASRGGLSAGEIRCVVEDIPAAYYSHDSIAEAVHVRWLVEWLREREKVQS